MFHTDMKCKKKENVFHLLLSTTQSAINITSGFSQTGVYEELQGICKLMKS